MTRKTTILARRKKKGLPIHGILLLDKQKGFSSNSSLQKAKRLFNAQKAGHTGSLDPLATGILPICFGEATKVSTFLLESNKRYQTQAQLGKTSSTGDAEGDILVEREIPELTSEQINQVLAQFTGEISQIPPMYSALKKDGKPLYELARKGKTVERKVRQVTIYELNLIEKTSDRLVLDVACSKGTYIRTLVEDIGEALGCGAYVKSLRRTEVSPFENCESYNFEQLEALNVSNRLATSLLPVDRGLQQWQSVTISQADTRGFLMGQTVKVDLPNTDENLRVYSEAGDFLGIGYIKHPQSLAPRRVMAV